jgi:demethylmenaquinone methyltransferase/2-methoxy-6-polyprenyl-1,4-benzoquinol methylase
MGDGERQSTSTQLEAAKCLTRRTETRRRTFAYDIDTSKNIALFEGLDRKREQHFDAIWRESIPQVFADVPNYYDRANAVASLGLCAWWSSCFIKEIDLADDAVLLDVCSGTHDVPRRLLRDRPRILVYAIDSSPEMIREGQRLAKTCRLSINAEVADAHQIPFKDGTFDAVTLQFATRHLRIVKVFKEIHRVLKPGGIFYHSDMLRPKLRIIEAPYLWYLNLAVRATAALFGSKMESKKCLNYFTESINNYLKPNEMAEALRAVGFVDIRYRSFLTGVLCYHISKKPIDRT